VSPERTVRRCLGARNANGGEARPPFDFVLAADAAGRKNWRKRRPFGLCPASRPYGYGHCGVVRPRCQAVERPSFAPSVFFLLRQPEVLPSALFGPWAAGPVGRSVTGGASATADRTGGEILAGAGLFFAAWPGRECLARSARWPKRCSLLPTNFDEPSPLLPIHTSGMPGVGTAATLGSLGGEPGPRGRADY